MANDGSAAFFESNHFEVEPFLPSGEPQKGNPWLPICIILIVLMIVLGAVIGWRMLGPKGDTGSYVIPQGDMTAEEAQTMLDEQVTNSRITVSLSPSIRLRADGSMRVNFIVEEPNNGFSERLEVEQDGQIVYASGAVAPGNGIEWCQAPDAHTGPAIATVYALDGDGHDRGNPVSVELEIIEDDESPANS